MLDHASYKLSFHVYQHFYQDVDLKKTNLSIERCCVTRIINLSTKAKQHADFCFERPEPES
jgi:hypothetical protein